MNSARKPNPVIARTLLPILIVAGPLACAAALTTLGYVLFKNQAVAATQASGSHGALSGPLEYTIILALAGLLASLVLGVVGLMLYNKSRSGIETREAALADGMERLVTVDLIAQRIARRGERRETMAIAWNRRQREAIGAMNGLAAPRAALQRVAGDIWAGVSQPGAPMDPATAMRMARESAVAAAALGAALDDLRSLVAAPSAEIEEIAELDDALVADLIALDELTSQTRHALEAATGEIRAVRPPSDSRWRDIPYLRDSEPIEVEPRIDGRPGVLGPGGTGRRAGFPPAPPSTGNWPSTQDTGRARPPAPDRRADSRPPGAQPFQPGASSSQWRRPFPGPSGAQNNEQHPQRPAPRDRDDSSSRWLND
ncbi:MAG TPA: hypothetical protein VF808_00925 [Ktedonobacterales bacterium]